MWWLVLSALFFVLNAFLFLVMAYLLYVLAKAIKDIQPKVVALTDKVHEIGQKVDNLTTTVQTTVENVGGKAKDVAGSVSAISHVASQQFERFSPFVIGALTAIRLIKALAELKRGHSLKTATTQAALDEDAREKPENRRKLAVDKKRQK